MSDIVEKLLDIPLGENAGVGVGYAVKECSRSIDEKCCFDAAMITDALWGR